MKKRLIISVLTLTFLTASSQTIFGKWITVDENGSEKSVVEIYEEDEKVYGKIVEIFDSSDKDALCVKCKDEDYNKPILGLVIIKGLTLNGVYYRNGSIFDPEKGKSYKCRLSFADGNLDVLEVRGYVAFMYESQYWKRVK